MKKIVLVLILIIVVALTGCSLVINGKEVTSIDFSGGNIPAEKTVVNDESIDAQVKLNVSNTVGKIDFKTWDGNSVKITSLKKVRSSSEDKAKKLLDDVKIIIEKSSSSVDVSVKYKTTFGGINNQSVEMEVLVPKNIKYIKGKSASGGVTLNGFKDAEEFVVSSISGSVDVQDSSAKSYKISTTSGMLSANGVTGDGVAKSISGEIELQNITGDLEASTTSGRISVDGMEGGIVDAGSVSGSIDLRNVYLKANTSLHTISGSIDVEASKIDSNGEYKYSSISGSVNLQLPENCEFNLDANSVSGSISNSFQGTFDSGNHHVTGKIGNGGADVKVNSISGSVNITK